MRNGVSSHHYFRSSSFVAVAALVVMFGAAIAFQYTAPVQADIFGRLSDLVKTALADPTPARLMLGGVAFGAWLSFAIAMGLLLFVVCLLVEVALEGPPTSWTVTFNAAVMQGIGIAYVVLINPFVAGLLPETLGLSPLLRISQNQLPAWIAPVAPFALAVLSVFILNFSQYWAHRAQHSLPLLWKFHAVHHSVREMDSLNAVTHPVDTLFWQLARSTLLTIVIVDVQMMLWIVGILTIHDRFLHTRARVNFGVFKDILIDNRHHFVHHSSDPRDFDKNFSAVFTFWDRVFGTYAEPRDIRLVVTGLDSHKPPRTLWQFVSARLETSEGNAVEKLTPLPGHSTNPFEQRDAG